MSTMRHISETVAFFGACNSGVAIGCVIVVIITGIYTGWVMYERDTWRRRYFEMKDLAEKLGAELDADDGAVAP